MTAPATRREALQALGRLALAFAASSARAGPGGAAAGIVSVRVWPARDYTRVTIESDGPLLATHRLTDSPPRLAVDIDGLQLDAALRDLVGKVRADDPYIVGVRVGQFQPRVVRLVFDLKQPVRPELFALAPVAAYRHRLVFDLFPILEADPLLALVRDRERAEQEATRAVQDALGDLIARVDRAASAVPAATPETPPPAAPSAPPSSATPSSATPPAAPPPSSQRPPSAPTAAERARAERLVIVALDPGHGGEDPGAVGPSGLREKDVVLAIGLALRERLDAVTGTRAMLTRDADFFVPLHERVRKARRVQADLFVSLHADAFMRAEARGASVFALSATGASSAAARWMAARENAADAVGGVNRAHARDPQLLQAMLDMSTTAQIKDSLTLGREVLGRIGAVGRLHKPQVEQAGFAVLKAPDIPSILVETAFISNPQEEELLRSAAYRERVVDAIAEGIARYFARNPPLARQRPI